MSVSRAGHLLASAILITPVAFAAGSADKGKNLFVANGCSACHGVTRDAPQTLGPNLVGVVGRKAGATPGLLPASDAMKKYGVIWSAKTLDEFLINPSAKVPGTAMAGVLSDARERGDVIAYLTSLKK